MQPKHHFELTNVDLVGKACLRVPGEVPDCEDCRNYANPHFVSEKSTPCVDPAEDERREAWTRGGRNPQDAAESLPLPPHCAHPRWICASATAAQRSASLCLCLCRWCWCCRSAGVLSQRWWWRRMMGREGEIFLMKWTKEGRADWKKAECEGGKERKRGRSSNCSLLSSSSRHCRVEEVQSELVGGGCVCVQRLSITRMKSVFCCLEFTWIHPSIGSCCPNVSGWAPPAPALSCAVPCRFWSAQTRMLMLKSQATLDDSHLSR